MKYRELHQLVRSLSRAEKRYFKVQAQSRPGPKAKSYLYLFDLLNAQKTYAPNEIKEQFMHSGHGKHFSWARNNLFHLILRSMRSFHEARNHRQELAGLLTDIRFLFNRRIYGKCDQLIRKGLQMARSYDEALIELSLLEFARGRLLNGLKKGYSTEINQVLSEEESAIASYSLRMELTRIYSQLAAISRQSLRPEMEQLQEQFGKTVAEKLEGCYLHPSFYIRHFSHLIAGTFFVLVRDYEAAFLKFKALVEVWEAHPRMVPAKHSMYQKVLNNFLTCCHLTERFQHYEAVLPRMNLDLAETQDEKGEIFQNAVHHHLIYSINTDRLEKALALVPEIEEGLQTYGSKINPARHLTLILNISTTFFLLEKYADCGKWIRKILHWERSAVRQDLRQYALLIRLVVVYEQGEFDYLESLVHSTREYFRRREGAFSFERFVMRCIHRLVLAKDTEARNACFVENAEELNALAHAEGEVQKANGYDEVRYWLESHISGLSIRRVMKDSRGKQND